MNKHCFRLIFSKPLGFLIPVAEISTAQRKPGQQGATAAVSPPSIAPVYSLKRLVLSLLLAGSPSWAAAEILLDRSTGATVSTAANGVPVIEIAKAVLHERTPSTDNGNAPANNDMPNLPATHTVVMPVASEAVNTSKSGLPVGESTEYRPSLPSPKEPKKKIEVDNYLFVNLQPDNKFINRGERVILKSLPDNSVAAHYNPESGISIHAGDIESLAGKKVGYVFHGHGDVSKPENPTIGYLGHNEIMDLFQKIETIAPPHEMSKVRLLGCITNCDSANLTKLVQNDLINAGKDVPVKGYDATISILNNGKVITHAAERLEPKYVLDSSWVRLAEEAPTAGAVFYENKTYKADLADPRTLALNPYGKWLLTPVSDENYRRLTNESLAGSFYDNAGIDSHFPELVWDKDNDIIYRGERYSPFTGKPQHTGVTDNFGKGLVMDVWLSNSAILNPKTNADGEPVLIRSTNETLEYKRGDGYPRDEMWNDLLTDIQKLLKPGSGPAGDMWAAMSETEQRKAIKKVTKITNEEICDQCNRGPGNFVEREKLSAALKGRRHILAEVADLLINKPK